MAGRLDARPVTDGPLHAMDSHDVVGQHADEPVDVERIGCARNRRATASSGPAMGTPSHLSGQVPQL